MNSIYLLITSIFLFSNCITQQNEDLSILYKATTRGNFIELTLSYSQLKYSDTKRSNQKALSKKELKKIDSLIQQINLHSIHSLVAPSTKSHFDGALAATISINCNKLSYESSTFDHGNPPQELKELIDYIFDLIYTHSN